MRIAVTADPFIAVPPINYGGIERVIHFLVEGLANNGHEVLLVAHADSKVNVELISYPKSKNGPLAQIQNVYTINKIKKWKPDVIHSFSRLAYLLPFLNARIPKLMSYQREPTISQVKKAMGLSRQHTLAFSGCSDYISNKIKPYAPAYTIYNGIDLELYNFKNEVKPDAPLIFLGRIEPIKGTHIAVDAALKTGKDLIIAGNITNEHLPYFNEKIKPHLGKQITYVGEVNDAQKNAYLGVSSALLMPIEWDEPFGIVMAEALACGTPVIAYPRGAAPEVVEHGTNGFLANSFNELCGYINKLNEISRSETRKTATENFSSAKIVDDYTALYTRLINNLK